MLGGKHRKLHKVLGTVDPNKKQAICYPNEELAFSLEGMR